MGGYPVELIEDLLLLAGRQADAAVTDLDPDEAGLGVARAARLANQPELVEPALKGALSAARALGNTAGEQRVLGMLDLRNAPDGRS